MNRLRACQAVLRVFALCCGLPACMPDTAPRPTLHPREAPAAPAPPAAALLPSPPEPVSEPPTIDDLYRAAAADVKAGRPLVVSVHVALCDNASQGIVPVPAALGDGNRPDANLYWGARYGLRTVFDRAPGWTRETRVTAETGDLIEIVEYRRRVGPQGAWAAAGVTGAIDVRLRAFAWRGRAMAAALAAFAKEALEPPEQTLVLDDGRCLPLPDPPRVVGFVGHNGLMDLPEPVWPFKARRGAAKPARHTGVFVLACKSRPYFLGELGAPRVHALTMTASLLAPEGYVAEALVEAFAAGAAGPAIPAACAAAYARYQKIPEPAARRIFVAGP
jgi:hypothetical protein